MDFIGELKLQWAKGYDGRKAEYIDRQTILYSCGNNINFVNESGEESVFSSPGEGVGPLAIHSINKVFAFAELRLDPKVYVYSYPELEKVSELSDGAKLEYLAVAFSTCNYLATVSGVPEFELILWNYTDGTKLCSTPLSQCEPTGLSFNPANWRQLCITTPTDVKILTYESASTVFVARDKTIRLPLTDVLSEIEVNESASAARVATARGRMSVELPSSAVAGLVGEMAETFDETQDKRPRVIPVSHAWHPTGDVYVGCEGGQLVQIDGETFVAKALSVAQGSQSKTNLSDACITIEKKLSFADEQSSGSDIPLTASMHKVTSGSFNKMALHRDGLFVAGDDGILRQFELKKDIVSLMESYDVGVPVTSLSFNTMYTKLAIGSSQGSIHIYDPNEPGSADLFFDQHNGNFVGIACLCPGSEFIVSVREDGQVQVWTLDMAKLVCSIGIEREASCLACAVLSHVAVVGTVSGHLYFVDLHDFSNPRIINRVHMHQGPVKQIVFDWSGHYLMCGGTDGHVFIMDGRPSKNFFVYGHTSIDGEILAISSFMTEKSPDLNIVVTTNNTEDHRLGATKLVSMAVSPKIVEDYRLFHESLKYDFADKAISKINLNFTVPSYGAVITAGRVLYTLAQSNKNIHRIIVPNEPPKKATSKDSYLSPEAEYPGHQLPGGTLVLSPHSKWLASAGADGKLYLRAVGALDRVVGVYPHDYRHGGVRNIAFSGDCQYILTTGVNDGVLCCYKWDYTDAGQEKAKSAIGMAHTRRGELLAETNQEELCLADLPTWEPLSENRPSTSDIRNKEQERKLRAVEDDAIYTTPTPVPSSDATWLEARELEAIKEEDKEYAQLKHDLRSEIREMRRQLQAMMKENEVLPEIEKLGHHEFDLDTEEQARLQALGDAEVARIREEIDFENLAKMYLKELIKAECWDNMVVKGRALTAFNSVTEVSNYPMRARSRHEVQMLETVQKRRRIEVAEKNARKEITEVPSKTTAGSAGNEEGEEEEDEGKEKPSTIGSMADPEVNETVLPSEESTVSWYTEDHGAQYGGACDLFYSQFELHTREQKVSQIVLLQDAIHRIKETFNKEFDDVFAKKEQEIGKIVERNNRIRKILRDLDLAEEITDPKLSLIEKPEMLLTVLDHEVTVERYLTAEQRKKLEEEQKLEEERRLREKGDNARERALDMMMGGVLEIKKEDELKKDIPIPQFMQTKKAEDFSEEEVKQVKEYERKVVELQEEREKYRKQLETELKKLQGMIQDTESNFDDVLHQLFARKVKTELVVYQEELKIIRIQYSLMLEEEIENHERELFRLLEHKRILKVLAERACSEGRKNGDAFRELYDILTAEDKVMDKAFKREFNDVSAIMVDQLHKLFRRRPRGVRVQLKGGETPMYDNQCGNPFSDRPSSARQRAMAHAGLETALAELDKEANMPEGLDYQVWHRMCKYRRQKIESEQLVKEKALVLADINAFLQRRQEEDETLKHEIEELAFSVNKLKEDRFRFICNLEVQLLLKQGQVEVDAGDFIHDYKDSVLIHRSVVEDLNGRIRALGEMKISSMVESKDFRKGIIQLEWEHKKNLMTIQDLQKKMRDITMIKVTREIQAYLSETDHEGKKAQEIATLEQTLVVQKKNHEKMVEDRKRILRDLRRTIRYKDNDNEELDSTLEELNVSVNERNHINDVNADKTGDAGAEKRYQEIVQRRKLVDLAKAQAQEVAVLRAEVERLRMRTFPALVQVEH